MVVHGATGCPSCSKNKQLAAPEAAGLDMVIIRECTEGLFYTAAVHNRSPKTDNTEARETLRITRSVTERLTDFAFKLAQRRKARGGKGEVTCVDKANVFQAFAFFRTIFDERAAQFPDIAVRYAYVDAMALDLVRKPWDFDVLVMENIFGDERRFTVILEITDFLYIYKSIHVEHHHI